MKQTIDNAAFNRAYLDTPFDIPAGRVRRAHRRHDPDDLLDVPGVCVKARRLDGGPFLLTGKLVSHSAAAVVVRSRPAGFNGDLKCVWEGTAAQYASMWTVD